MERSEEREALLSVVYSNAPTLLDARRAKQRKRRKALVDEEMQGSPAKQRKGQPRQSPSSEQVLRALFVQEVLMSALHTAPPPS